MAQTVKSLPAMQETQVWSLGQEDPLEKEMATTPAWRIPQTGACCGVTRVGHNWVANNFQKYYMNCVAFRSHSSQNLFPHCSGLSFCTTHQTWGISLPLSTLSPKPTLTILYINIKVSRCESNNITPFVTPTESTWLPWTDKGAWRTERIACLFHSG